MQHRSSGSVCIVMLQGGGMSWMIRVNTSSRRTMSADAADGAPVELVELGQSLAADVWPARLRDILTNEVASLPEHLGRLQLRARQLVSGDVARHRQGKLGTASVDARLRPWLCARRPNGRGPTQEPRSMAFSTSTSGSFQDFRVADGN